MASNCYMTGRAMVKTNGASHQKATIGITIAVLIGMFLLKMAACSEPTASEQNGIGEKYWPINGMPMRQSCFTADDLTMLQARHRLEQMIPERREQFEPLDDDTIVRQMSFLAELEQRTVTVVEDSRTQELLKLALADAFGAYLYGYFVPVMKFSYYGGFVSIKTASDVMRAMRKYQAMLGGQGTSLSGQWKLYDLDSVHFYQQVNGLTEEELKQGISNCNLLPQGTPLNAPLVEIDDETQELLLISLPYHRNGSVFNPRSRSASRILMQYYIETGICFQGSKDQFVSFQRELSAWIANHTVLILASETTLYPAFEAILRVKKTIDNGHNKFPKTSLKRQDQGLWDEQSDDVGWNFSEHESSDEMASETAPEEMSLARKMSIWIGCSLAVLLAVYIVLKLQQNRNLIANNKPTHRRRRRYHKKLSRKVDGDEEIVLFDRQGKSTPVTDQNDAPRSTTGERKMSMGRFFQRFRPRSWKSSGKGYQSVATGVLDEANRTPPTPTQRLQRKENDNEPQPGPSGLNRKKNTQPSCRCLSCIERESCQDSDESRTRGVTYR